MAERLYDVTLTATFLERLAEIEAFLLEADALSAFGRLLASLRGQVVPNLAHFPRFGRSFLANAPSRQTSPSSQRGCPA